MPVKIKRFAFLKKNFILKLSKISILVHETHFSFFGLNKEVRWDRSRMVISRLKLVNWGKRFC